MNMSFIKHTRMQYTAPVAEACNMLPGLLCDSNLVEGGIEDISTEDWTL